MAEGYEGRVESILDVVGEIEEPERLLRYVGISSDLISSPSSMTLIKLEHDGAG